MAETIRNHPDLVDAAESYQLYRDFTDGRKKVVAKYLVPYLTESSPTPQASKAFANRLRRAYNINQCRPYLRIHRGHLSQKIEVKGFDGEVQERILKDVSGTRKSLKQFSTDVLWHYMRDGRVGVLVDREPGTEKTKAKAKAAGERSYQVLYDATEIHYWEHWETGPNRGKLKTLILKEPDHVTEKRRYPQLRRFQLPEKGNFIWQKLRSTNQTGLGLGAAEAQYEIKDEGEGPFDEIPFFILGCGPDDSFLSDISPLNEAAFNKRSVKDNVNHNQGFQRNFAIGAKEDELKAAGESLITRIGSADARIMSLPAGEPTALENEEKKLDREIDRRGKMEFNNLSEDTRQVQAANSRALDMRAKIALYDETLEMLEEALERLFTFHMLYETGQPGTVDVTIARDYGLEDEAELRAEEQQVFNWARELQARKVQQAIVRSRLPRLRLIPKEGQTKEEMMAELREELEQEAPAGSSLFDFRQSLGARFP